jgi:hypothetical protein
MPVPCVVTFRCCDKTPKKTNLKEERFILAHGFRGFNLMAAGSIALELK